MSLLRSIDVVTGRETFHRFNTRLRTGQTFKLVGYTMTFKAVRVRKILGGSCTVVDGVTLDGKQRTTARVVDTVNPKAVKP